MCYMIVILSSDDSYFLEYWPIVHLAWEKFFPEWELKLAHITIEPRSQGIIHDLPLIPHIPTANLAKMARYYLASLQDKEVCIIHDIDSAPLNRDYGLRLLSQRQSGKLMAVGAEVYIHTQHAGKYPTSWMMAEGKIFQQLFNPRQLEWSDLVKSWIGMKRYDHKEDISAPANIFSDESLLRALIGTNNPLVQYVNRDVDIQKEWLDRSWWDDKKHPSKFIEVNFLRPPRGDNLVRMLPVYQYVMQ